MNVDILIKNGRVIDPENGVDRIETVAVKGRRVVPYTSYMGAKTVIDATGCLVTPGLIDFHAHIFNRGTDSGANPDLAMIPYGVTTVVDAGSSGVSTYRSFLERLNSYYIKTKFFIHVSPTGQVTHQYPESLYPEKWNIDKFEEAFEVGKDKILGFKMRVSKNVVGTEGIKPLYAALELATRFQKKLVVHVTDPPVLQSEIANALRPGDVFCHVFHNKGNNILDGGHVYKDIWKAKERGVIFDCCHGSANFSFDIAEIAMKQGFNPDVISTDLNTVTWCKSPLYNLTSVMSKFLYLGMELKDIIACVTSTPARLIHMDGELGTLTSNSCADIAIMKIVDKEVTFIDTLGEKRNGTQFFVPLVTILDGAIVYRSPEMCF